MLSNSSTLLLGLITEKPINPYEINNILKYLNIENWFAIASSSIYATIKILHKKGYITGTDIKEGNMPEKTVYTITPEGKHIFFETLKDYLLDLSFDHVKLNLAMIFICHLKRADALNLLSERAQKLEKRINEMQIKSNYLKTSGVVSYGIQAVRFMIYIAKANRQTTQELIELVQNDTEWNHFVTNYV